MTKTIVEALTRALAGIGCLIISALIAASLLDTAFAAEGDYSVEYRGKQAGLVGDADFFAHAGSLLPGDEISGTVTVSNADATPQKFYFSTEQTGAANRAEANELLDLMALSITSERMGEVYSGPLRATALEGGVCLGTFAKGQSDTLTFSVSTPEGLDNEYAMAQNSVKWVLSTQDAPKEPGGIFGQTGDAYAKLLLGGACLLVCLWCLLVLVRRRKRDDDKEAGA